jgi:hypothetical protein
VEFGVRRFYTVLFVLLVLSVLSINVFAEDLKLEVDIDLHRNIFVYRVEKKDPLVAIAAASIPSLGHAYAGDWKRGVKFLIAEVLEMGLIINAARASMEDSEMELDLSAAIGPFALIALVGTKIWEYIDVYNLVNEYNTSLRVKYGLVPDVIE